jgi:hypothetical protein
LILPVFFLSPLVVLFSFFILFSGVSAKFRLSLSVSLGLSAFSWIYLFGDAIEGV